MKSNMLRVFISSIPLTPSPTRIYLNQRLRLGGFAGIAYIGVMNAEITYTTDQNGKQYFNYWGANGEGVVCEIVNDKLIHIEFSESGEALPGKELSLTEYLSLVKQQASVPHA